MLNPTVSYKLRSKIEKCMKKKKSNVIVSLDLSTPKDIISAIENLGYDALGFKLHSDIIEFDLSGLPYGDRGFFYGRIAQLRQEMDFLIIEDRKFSDIGNTVKLQSNLICPYADLITVHSLPGESIVEGLKENCIKYNCGVLLIGQMSCCNNLITDEYTKSTVDLAYKYSDFVVGFICQERLTTSSNFLNFSPGVKLEKSNDSLGQVYNTPETLREKGTDIFIVGRGIYETDNPCKVIHDYNSACYNEEEVFKQPCNSIDHSFEEPHAHTLKQLILQSNILKRGTFVLSSGETSPIYADFRLLTGFAPLMKMVAKEFSNIILRTNRDTSNIVLMGVPMGGIALASAVSMDSELGMVVVRDKRKEYGSKNLIEGMSIDYLRKKHIILIEDVITTGGSVENLIHKLNEEEGIEIKQAICILDRNKGGMQMLRDKYNLQVDSIFSLNDFI